ncbi:SWIM zinc finger protein [Xylariaceae sp. FL0804]|nr:SWIM zinc finger protein [Xylariaceae sp. FL0804]
MGKRKLDDTAGDGTTAKSAEAKRAKKLNAAYEEKDTEKRLRKFRPKPPQSFQVIYERATSQRFYVLSRSREGTGYEPEEVLEMAGSTGNIYTIRIARQPTCTCPHAKAGNQCKHIIYALSVVLRARFDLVYQLALLSRELRAIFFNCPPIEPEGDAKEAQDNRRKPIEGDCPICFTELAATEEIVYCRATCGQNIHKDCFSMWATTKRKSGNEVTCPMCRTAWRGDDTDAASKIDKTGPKNRDGYVNVADQLGISRVQDTRTYYKGPYGGDYTRYLYGGSRSGRYRRGW